MTSFSIHIYSHAHCTDFWDLLGQVSTLMETALISRRHGVGIRWQQIGSWDLSKRCPPQFFPEKRIQGQYFYVFLVVFIRSTSCCWSFHGHCIFIPGEEFSRPRWKRHEKTFFTLFRTANKLIIPWWSMKIDGPIDGPIVAADCPMIQLESPFEVEAVRRGHDVADSSTQVVGHHWGREVRLHRDWYQYSEYSCGTLEEHPFTS